ncbi:hypothetical protein CKO_01794 [Citrobacter koseri ATCC BAA-895]|uniref:Uncharacterized protein n=1 Tax=Citrobacter koseri (strain ATCC BAA-895 / CDC 4225-83 / SGSC4696) TaxID=290338 RepID=A8AHG1_CITK8|nr:hypothetical protein CKO_01794 [Citrobacter koseri ATCC BAA-895]
MPLPDGDAIASYPAYEFRVICRPDKAQPPPAI